MNGIYTSAEGAPDTVQHIDGIAVLMCAAEGTPLRGEQDALDLIGAAAHHGAGWVVVPASRCADAFFQLRTRVAGDIFQKFVNYGVGIAILGDISRHTAASSALRDLVRESNRGRHAWFVSDLDDLRKQLGRVNPPTRSR